jgi:hypothetical protein
MDKNAIDVLLAHKNVSSLEPADHAGLGLARAILTAGRWSRVARFRSHVCFAGTNRRPLSL